jgi:hypothetical protein
MGALGESKLGESKLGEAAGVTLTDPGATIGVGTPTADVVDTGVVSLSDPGATIRINAVPSNIGYGEWVIAGNAVAPTTTGETATPRTLTLAYRVTSDTLTAALRPLKTDEGKVDVLPQDDGGFVAVDRANGANTFEIFPPVGRTPLRESGDYHVARYEEQLVSQAVGEWDVELELTRDADRTDTPSVSQTPASDEWGFTTPLGQIATARVDAEFAGTGRDGVERFDVTARLTFQQAHVWEAAFARIAGTRVKSIPDETNVMVDDTGGDATVTVDTPATQSVITDGEYVVTEWSSERINDSFQRITFTLAET